MHQEKGKVIVTGAYGAIGKAITRQIAAKGYDTVLVGRDAARLEQSSQEVIRTSGNRNVSYEVVDLSRKSSIKDFAGRWNFPLKILINNAATTPEQRLETPEGIELQFATNVLGYFWMIEFFMRFMTPEVVREKVRPVGHKNGQDYSRIVNVASYWAGGLDLNDPEFRKRRYDNDSAYRQSKQANRMMTLAHAERLQPLGITVNSCHPGDVSSKLSNNLGFGGYATPDQGAATPVWVATDQSLHGISGKYFEQLSENPCGFCKDNKAVEALFRLCQSY